MKTQSILSAVLVACSMYCVAETVSYSIPVLTVQANQDSVVRGSGKLNRCPFSFVETSGTSPVKVSIVEDIPTGAGNELRSSVWMALTTAALTMNHDLSGETILFETSGYVDGPSAGSVLCLAVMSAIEGRTFPDDFAMTGTIMVDGTIGAVGGVAEKICGASRAGIKRMCIPASMRLDREDGYTDLLVLGKSLNIEIHQVSTIFEAYQVLHKLPEVIVPRMNPMEVCRLPSHVETVLKGKYIELIKHAPRDTSLSNELIEKSMGEYESGLFGAATMDIVTGLTHLDLANYAYDAPPVHKYPALEHELPATQGSMLTKLLGDGSSKQEFVAALKVFCHDLKELGKGNDDDELEEEVAPEDETQQQDNTNENQPEDWFDDRVVSPSGSQLIGILNNDLANEFVIKSLRDDVATRIESFTDWDSLNAEDLNTIRSLLVDQLNLWIAGNLYGDGGDVSARTWALYSNLLASIPFIRPNANVRQVEELFFKTMKAAESSFNETGLEADNPLIIRMMALFYCADFCHGLSADNENALTDAIFSEVEALSAACALLMRTDPTMENNSAFFTSVMATARENALVHIAECQKHDIPCVMPIIYYQMAESERDNNASDDTNQNRFNVLENYLSASIGAKALILCFEGQKPELNDKGFCSMITEWDRDTRTVTYLGTDGEPVMRGDFAGYRHYFDEEGKIVGMDLLDSKRRAVRHQRESVSYMDEYDPSDHLIRRTYCDTSWKPAPRNDGVLFETYGYDDDGNQTSWEFFGETGSPIVCSDGMAVIRRRFNKRGQETWRRFYGIQGESVLHADGNAGFDVVYDKKGNLRKLTYVDPQGKPTMTSHGFAVEERKYDEAGNEVERAWYDAKGDLVSVDGFAKVQFVFDKAGNMTERKHFGADNRLTRDGNNVAVIRWTYDQFGQTIECRYYGPNGDPTQHSDGSAFWQNIFDSSGRIIDRKYYDLDGNEITIEAGN